MSSSTTIPDPAVLTLADFTSPGLIIPHLRGQDFTSVIQELCQTMQFEKRVLDLLPFYHAALNREFLVSTDMEAGMAFPHARLPTQKNLSFALGRSEEPFAWGLKATRSVRLVFLIAVPATDSAEYLLLISGFARMSKDAKLLARLHTAQDTFQMLEVLQQVQLRTNSTSNSKSRVATGPG